MTIPSQKLKEMTLPSQKLKRIWQYQLKSLKGNDNTKSNAQKEMTILSQKLKGKQILWLHATMNLEAPLKQD